MAKLAKKYGNVMGFGFGVHYAVLLSGYEEMKDILKRPETCDSRFQFSYVEDRNFNKNLGNCLNIFYKLIVKFIQNLFFIFKIKKI